MSDELWGVPVSRIALVHVRGCAAPYACMVGSVRVCTDEDDAAYDKITWRDERGSYRRAELAEVVGIGWSQE